MSRRPVIHSHTNTFAERESVKEETEPSTAEGNRSLWDNMIERIIEDLPEEELCDHPC